MGKQKVMTLYEKALEEGIEQGVNLDDQEFKMVDRLENYNNLFIWENHEKRN